jgi:hypothetical protein
MAPGYVSTSEVHQRNMAAELTKGKDSSADENTGSEENTGSKVELASGYTKGIKPSHRLYN